MKVMRKDGTIEEMTLERLQKFGPLLSGMKVEGMSPLTGELGWRPASRYAAQHVETQPDGSVAIVES